MEDIFEGFGSNKTTRFWICKTGGLSLWVGLQLAIPTAINGRHTREEYKAAVKSWPYDVSDCRCKDCRYLRLTRD
jgi:hypothetical protein